MKKLFMTKGKLTEKDRRAAIICSHAARGRGILRAVRDEPTMPEDSGWQFSCNSADEENPDEAKVWLIYEILDYEPSLAPFIESPPGTLLTRRDPDSGWTVSAK